MLILGWWIILLVAIDGIQVYIAKIQLYAHLLYFHPWRMNNMIQHVVFVDVHPI